MKKLPYVKSYQDLLVYEKVQFLSKELYHLSNEFPTDELYSLTSQMRRSSRSIGAQIAEAWAKRFYQKHFISKLTDADAELNETEHWITVAHHCGYLPEEKKEQMVHLCHEIGRMIGSMIAKANRFCGKEGTNYSNQ